MLRLDIPIKILYAEDDFSIQKSISAILKNKHGKDNVFVASNGKEALELYKKNEINIIITDIKMPIMDGIEFIRQIKMIDSKIPIIVVSAYEKDAFDLEFPICNYLVKPIQKFTLLFAIETCLYGKHDK